MMATYPAAAMSHPDRLIVPVRASPAGVRTAADALERFEADHGLDPAAAWPVQVALDEILSNVVRHGGAGRDDAVIEVTFALADGSLQVTVVDDGPELDPLTLPAPDTTSPLDARQPGGLGVYLVKQLMDRVDYVRRDGRNCLTIAWRLPPAGAPKPGKG
jgi:anti-sigma regulatory factor (Ser/Thr protein kinase)